MDLNDNFEFDSGEEIDLTQFLAELESELQLEPEVAPEPEPEPQPEPESQPEPQPEPEPESEAVPQPESPAQPKKQGGGWKKFCTVVRRIGHWIYRLRGLIMAIPVVIAAVWLAMNGMQQLPETIGLFMQSNGEYAYTLTKETAVFGSLGLTAVCLIMSLISRRKLYPWLVSILTLLIPAMLLATSTFGV